MKNSTNRYQFSSLVELLRFRAVNSPDSPGFTFVSNKSESRQTLSYGELDRLARCIAAQIQTDFGPGERALLLYPPGLDFISAFFGCLYAEVVAVPAYPPRDNSNAMRLRAIAEDAQARLILTTVSQKSGIEGWLPANGLGGTLEVVASDMLMVGEALWRETFVDRDKLAFIQYTSGSSGNPKGVMVSHGNILQNEMIIQAAFGHTPDSIMVGWLPLFHDLGLMGNTLQPLYVGYPVVLFSPVAFIQNPLMWLQLISQYHATTSGAPNFAYEHCVNRINEQQKAGLDLSSWETAFNGAEPVRAETLERFHAAFASCGFRKEAFYPCYGMAETTLFISGGRRLTLPKTACLDGDGSTCVVGGNAVVQEKVSCGYPWCDQKVLIVDPRTLVPCPDGKVGEIWTSGLSIAQGYWNRPEETEKVFQAYLADHGEGPFLRTGDLGFISEGELYVTGRLKELIIIRGRNHYPQDIEQTVEQSHPALSPGSGAAFSVEVDGEEKLVILQEVKRVSLRRVNTEEVCACVRRAVLQQHELNVYAVILLKPYSIPKTSSGKIRRNLCQSKYLSGELEMIGQWCVDAEPRTALHDTPLHTLLDHESIEGWLVYNISKKTNTPPAQIDLQEPMAAYGLDSLGAVSLSGELEEWLGRKLSPTLVYDYPTVASLARYLAGEAPPLDHSAPAISFSSSERASESIAVIGMGCRFPGASDPEAFWKLLADGKDAITVVPPSRWDRNRYPAATGYGGFLDSIELFDPLFFGIAPREAECMDPQQRLLLEVTWEALESAFLHPSRLAGTQTGVFIGISSHDYLDRQRGKLASHVGTGNSQSIAANRLSYTFDLRGPSWAVDTACSSSLVAIHQACQSLRQSESDTAIAGGVNVILSPELSCIFYQAGMLAENGRCKTFDASADGYVRGEGCGVVILRRLSDALADGNPILALIRGSAVNQDGRSNGLTAPNGLSQQAVIWAALKNAGIEPGQVGYVEAHGTGTSLGDPIEFNSLAGVFSPRGSTVSPCMIGSVKTNIGHLEAAAGIAGLIKTILAIRYAKIPPHLHLRELNPHVAPDIVHLAVPTSLKPWPQGEHPRIAGVSSFGFGGTNAHVVVQEPPPFENSKVEEEASAHLLIISAREETALKDLAKRYETLLQNEKGTVKEICARAATGRQFFEQRLAVAGKTVEDLLQALAAYEAGRSDGRCSARRAPAKAPKLAFLFTGQGSQYAHMGRRLFDREPLFRAAMERCAAIADPLLEKPLLDVVFPENDQTNTIDETAWTQPALFALEYSLAELWRSWGVVPDVVAGHSLGEYVAACVAGVFSLEQGMRLVTERARLMQGLRTGGAMISVAAEEEFLAEKIRSWQGPMSIAAVNGPKRCVVSGAREAVETLAIQLAAEGVQTTDLRVSQAFHSPLMAPMLEEFGELLAKVDFSAPRIPLISHMTGTISEEVASPGYWVRHVMEPVRFLDAIVELQRQGFHTYLEIGPEPVLLSLAGHCMSSDVALLPSLKRNTPDQERLSRTIGELYTRGVNIDWHSFYPREAIRNGPSLPTYPFQRKRYWIAGDQESHPAEESSSGQLPDGVLYEIAWRPAPVNDGPAPPKVKRNWLIFSDRGGVGERLATRLRVQGDSTCLVFAGKTFGKDSKGYVLDPVEPADFSRLFQETWKGKGFSDLVHLWSLDCLLEEDSSQADLGLSLQLSCRSTLHSLQSLLKYEHTGVSFSFVTQEAVAVKFAEPVRYVQSPLWGMVRVMTTEHPELDCCCIDLEKKDENDLDTLYRELITPRKENQIAYRESVRYAARMVPLSPIHVPKSCHIRNGATYIVTGGAGGLGIQVAKWLVAEGAGTVILTGRSASSKKVGHLVEDLSSSRTKVVYVSADVADCDCMAGLFQEIAGSMQPLRGIIHAAGILDDSLLENMPWEMFEKVLVSKVRGTWNLHQLTRGIDLDFFVCFSSAASLFGSPTQANYAAANAFVDALCQHRKSLGLPAVALNWGPWKDGGMAASPSFLKNMQKYGIDSLTSKEGVEILSRFLAVPVAQVAVVKVGWNKFFQNVPVEKAPLFQIMAAPEDEKTAGELSSFALQVREKTGEEQFSCLLNFLRDSITSVLGMGQDELPLDRSLNTLGLDSLMVLELINMVQKETGVKLLFAEIMDGMTLQGLTVTLQGYMKKNNSFSPGFSEASPAESDLSLDPSLLENGVDPAEMLANLHHLSDDEVRDALETMQSGKSRKDSSVKDVR